MGFEVNRFKGLGVFADVLKCPICCGIFAIDPVTTPCGHTFCHECLASWLVQDRSCPNCRKPVSKLCKPPIVLVNIIGKLKIKCDFEDKGCKSVVPLDYLKTHVACCEFRTHGNVWLLARNMKHWFGLNSNANVSKRDVPLSDYDGEQVEIPQRPKIANSSEDVAHDLKVLLMKLFVVTLLIVLAIVSIKAALWLTSVMCYNIRRFWGLTGMSTVELFSRTSCVLEKMILAGSSFLAALAAIFVTNSFVSLYKF